MKQLLKTLQHDENCNKYYYDKMLSDFELEARYNTIVRSIKNKWRNESMKYMIVSGIWIIFNNNLIGSFTSVFIIFILSPFQNVDKLSTF